MASRDQATLLTYLHSLENPQEVRWVAMDMWAPYREAVRLALPDARIVIDKWHVVRMANQAVNQVRRELRNRLAPREQRTLLRDRFLLLRRRQDLSPQDQAVLTTWLEQVPLLGQAYVVKEGFYTIWDAAERKQAMARFEAWQQQIPSPVAAAFQPVLEALGRWHEEIFSYFDYPLTNAATEGINGLIKGLVRQGRGYTWTTIRAKALLTLSTPLPPIIPYRRRSWEKAPAERADDSEETGKDLL
jgi:transposase